MSYVENYKDMVYLYSLILVFYQFCPAYRHSYFDY